MNDCVYVKEIFFHSTIQSFFLNYTYYFKSFAKIYTNISDKILKGNGYHNK